MITSLLHTDRLSSILSRDDELELVGALSNPLGRASQLEGFVFVPGRLAGEIERDVI